jgi:fibronectin type 3 domain-containing protein
MFELISTCAKRLACVGFVFMLALSSRSSAQNTTVPGEIVVGIRNETVAGIARPVIATAGSVIGQNDRLGLLHIKLRAGVSSQSAINYLLKQEGILFAHPVHIMRAVATPNDPKYATNQYGPQIIKANLAWDVYNPQSQRIIAIVDTGVTYTHPDLTNILLRDNTNTVIGWNVQNLTANANDDHGHGTHCAGIAAGEINNGIGIAGIAGWNPAIGNSTTFVKVMPVKVLDASGSGTDINVADGITWAVDHGANIISMSLGSTGTSAALDTAVQYAWNHGCVVVAAAGNNASNQLFYPAALNNVVSVASTDNADTLSYFSNYGSWVKVAAPGSSIYSTYPPSGYTTLSGTSMAAPHVAGVAALIWAHAPQLNNAQISAILQSSTDSYTPYSGHTIATGAGRINAYKAIVATGGGTSAPAPPTNLVAVPGNTQVSLSWTSSVLALSYNVKRATVSGGPYTTIATGVTATSYNDSGLTNGTTYYYVVTAVDSAGESNPSNQSFATPTPPQPNAVRINSGGTAYSGTIGSFIADTYFTSGTTVNRGNIAIAGTNDPTLYRTLRYGTTFGYSIPLVNGTYTLNLHFAETGGSSSGQRKFNVSVNGNLWLSNLDVYAQAGGASKALIKSVQVGITNGQLDLSFNTAITNVNAFVNAIEVIPQSTPPSAPTNLAGTPGDATVSLTWTGSAGATSYSVKRGVATGGPYTTLATGVTTTNYTDSNGLVNGQTFYYVVTASNSSGESGNSNQAAVTPITIPSAPTNLAASGGDGLVSLSWNAASLASSYNVKRSTSAGGSYTTIATGVTATSYSDNTVTNGTQYFYVVTAVNSAGESGNSNEASATPLGPPAPPTNLSATGGNAQVGLSWTASALATSYTVKRSTVTGGPYTTIVSNLTTISYTDTSVTNGTTYYYVVTGSNSVGESGNSNQASATPLGPPAAPGNLAATAGNAQVSLSWNASATATSYAVKRATVSGGPYTTVVSNLTTTNYTDTGLVNGTTYFYVVTASNSVGESGNSNQAPATPTNVTNSAVRVNSGGPAYAGTAGAFLADTYFTGGTTINRGTIAISNTSDPTLYRTLRYAVNFSYSVQAANGNYTLNLHFAETGGYSTNQRKFNVSVNGSSWLTNFDVFAQAGGASKALIKSIPVTVTNGKVDISFAGINNLNAFVNAVELVPTP